MSVFPTRRLLAWIVAWLATASLAAAWPPVVPALGLGLLLLAAATLADLALLARSPQPTLERRLPDRAFLRSETAIALRIENRGLRELVLDVFEELPDDVADEDPVFRSVPLPAGGGVDLRYAVWPRSRGDRRLGRAVLFARTPLGLLRRRQIGAGDEILAVYPDARRLIARHALDLRRSRELLGLRPTRRRGEGMDFESLREYVPGDDPRRIDWQATGRRGKLTTRLYQHERHHLMVVCVDTSRLMGVPCGDRSKLDFAVDATLALAITALTHGDRVEVIAFDREPHSHLSPRTQRGELGPLIELLRRLETRSVEPDYARLARHLATRRRGRAVLIVLTDLGEAPGELGAPLRLLRRHHHTLLVALRDPLFGRLAPGAQQSDLFEKLVLDDLLRDREAAAARLRRAAVDVIDLPAEQVTSVTLNRYLDLRFGFSR